GIARPFLPQCQRCGVLHMGPTDFDDVVPRSCVLADRVAERRNRRNETFLHVDGGGDTHRGGEGVIRRLGHVDVIVGMDRLVAAQRVPAIWQQRLEITSLTFMLNWVPLPVIQTCNGNMSWCFPARISSHA